MDIDQVVSKYIEIRDAIEEKDRLHKAATEKLREAMAKIEIAMLDKMQSMNVASLKTSAGTVYKTTKSSATLADREAYLDYVRRTERWDLLDIRANKPAVAEFKETENDLPPGVNWREQIAVQIRRS